MIEITKEPNADSRSAERPVTVDELLYATENHIAHVRQGLLYFSEMLNDAGWTHDVTKKVHMEEFHEAFSSGNIKESKWYNVHITRERHHLLANPPEDINLIDVIEHLTDCIMAGLSRSGEIYDIELTNELLQKAHKNTVELLKSKVVVKEE